MIGREHVNAKRLAPKDVQPVIHKGIKYVAPHFKVINKETHRGFVEAWDMKSGRKLWEIQVYKTQYDPSLEQDVQDVFISSLSVKNDRLVVENERSEIFEIDLETRTIIKVR